MDFQTLKQTLTDPQATELTFALDSGLQIAPHFHVTEVGRVKKDFVDCGGVRRTTETCLLQTLVAGDTDHRLAPAKLLNILDKSTGLGIDDEAEVEVEIQGQTIETYAIDHATRQQNRLAFRLTPKHTECLATDKCGIPAEKDLGLSVVGQACCSGGTC